MVKTSSNELKQQREKVILDAQAILDRAESENRDIDETEQTEWEGLCKLSEDLKAQINKQERSEYMDSLHQDLKVVTRKTQPAKPLAVYAEPKKHYSYFDAFRAWGMYPMHDQRTPSQWLEAAHAHGVNVAQKTFNINVDKFRAAQNVGTGSEGGYTRPDAPMGTLVEALLHFGGMRDVCRPYPTATGADLPIPTNDGTANEGEIVGESTEQTNELDEAFELITLKSWKYSSKIVRVSHEMMTDTNIQNFAGWLGENLGERIARIQNRHFTRTGNGTTQPKAILDSAGSGKVVSPGVGDVTFDYLLDLVHSVDYAYRQRGNCRFMMHDLTFKAVRKLKDQDDNPIFNNGVAFGAPATILDYPYTINNDLEAIAAGKKCILFGDFSYYYIRDVEGVTVVRLDELYAKYAQVGFLAWARADGRLVASTTNLPIKYFQA